MTTDKIEELENFMDKVRWYKLRSELVDSAKNLTRKALLEILEQDGNLDYVAEIIPSSAWDSDFITIKFKIEQNKTLPSKEFWIPWSKKKQDIYINIPKD